MTGIGHGPVRSLKAGALLNRALRQQDWLLPLGGLWSAPELAGASRQHLPRLKPVSAATTWQEIDSQDAGDSTEAPSASNTPTLQGMRKVVSRIPPCYMLGHIAFSLLAASLSAFPSCPCSCSLPHLMPRYVFVPSPCPVLRLWLYNVSLSLPLSLS